METVQNTIIIDESGVEIGITPYDRGMPKPESSKPLVLAHESTSALAVPHVLPQTLPQALSITYTETIPCKLKRWVVDGEAVLVIWYSAIALLGVFTTVELYNWLSVTLPTILAVLIGLGILAVAAKRRRYNAQFIYLKGCPTRSPGSHRVRKS